MRLIDADKLQEAIREYFKGYVTDSSCMVDGVDCNAYICRIVEERTTAFDVEKVVKQLEKEREQSYADFESYEEEHGMDGYDDWFCQGIVRAIEIVKRGGRDETN